MKRAVLYKKEAGGLKCLACLRRCLIANGQTGFCNTRKNVEGVLYSLYYGYFSGISYEPLKSKPFLHFSNPRTGKIYPPDELTLSIGGFGCNFQCQGCQNARISRPPLNIEEVAIRKSPEMIIQQAKSAGIKIIAFTWNEPTIMPEMVKEIAKLAHINGLNTVYVSNASLTEENVDLISPYIDAFRFDIKAGPNVGDQFYANYCNLRLPEATSLILETIKYVKAKGKHIELLTVLIPGHAPSCVKSVLSTAIWIKDNLGAATPWHLAKFLPAFELNSPALKTPDATIDYYVKMVTMLGLEHVYGVKDKGCDCYDPNKKSCCL